MPGASRQGGVAELLRLESAGRVDIAPLLPVDVSSLPRGLHARCVAFHPTRPLLAVGVATYIGGYDLVSGVRVGRVDVKSPPVALMFSRDGSLLVVATAEWHIFGISTATWRLRVLAPMNELRSMPLEHILLAVTGGHRPLVFFTRVGKPSIRMAVTGAGAEKKSADRKLKWGIKLKLDVNKAVVGLAAHPTSSQLLVLYEDGALRGYVMSSAGLSSAWGASYFLPGEGAFISRLTMTLNPLQVLPHPFTEGGCLLAVGIGSPSLLLMELVAKVDPQVVHRASMPDHMPLLGLGLLQAQAVLFAFTTTPDGQLKVLAWQTSNTPKGVTCAPIKVEVPQLDEDHAAAAAASASSGGGGSSSKGGGGSSSAAAGGPTSWHQLWGAGAYQDVLPNAAAGSFLLDKLLAPVVQSAVLHPTLGCVAVQRAPPPALRQAANIMQQRLGLISAPEALISRRTASVPLLRLLRPSLAGAAWPGAKVAAMHTDVAFWQPTAGLGTATLHFPCHLYFLSPGKLSKYSLASKQAGCFVSLPPIDGSGSPHEAKQLVHSPKQHAWLVFFEHRAAVGPAAAAAAGGAASRAASPAVSEPGGRGDGSGGAGGCHFTLVHDAAAAAQATWFLPGASGVFLGPQDLYFAILSNDSSTVSVYRTPGFKGKSHVLYTVTLAKPSSFGAGLFAGPGALAAPRVGAEAAAKAAKEAEEAADRAAKAAADAAERAAAGEGAAAPDAAAGEAAGADGAAAAAAAAPSSSSTAAAAAVSLSAKLHIRRPGETWRPTAESEDESAGGDMMVPVLGIGPAYQGPVGKGLAAKAKRHGAHHQGLGFVEAAEEVEEPGERHSGGGVIMWHAAGDKLVMAGLPAAGVQYAVGDDSDDPDAADASTAAAPDMGQVSAEHSLQLQPLERVVTVAWQNIQQGPPLEPYQAAAAILTTQRLLLVSGDLSVLASIDASCGSVGLASGISSLLWVGPALLYMTAAGQVMQLTWTGQTQHMASVAANPPPLLAGALADSLLLVRSNSSTGEAEVSSRAVAILQPLVLGWTSLASSGLLPKGLNTARAALQALLEAFDASNVSSGMLWSLIQGWCGDVAAALAAHATDVEPSVQLAANAAAGRWSAVVSALRGEHEHSVYYPAPAPQGSQLHHKLLAAAAGAIMHGQFGAAQECLEAAGEWETLMAVCVCCGDFGALRSMAAGLKSGAAAAAGGDQEAADIARLARALVSAYERGGRVYALNRIVGGSNNWRLRAKMADDSFFSNAADWSFGGPGKLPAMETSSFNAPAAFIQQGDVGPLPRADATTLGAYLGNADLTALGDAAAAALAAAGELSPGAGRSSLPGAASGEADFLANLDNLVALSSRAGDAGSKGGGNIRRSSTTSSVDSDLADTDAAAAAAAGGRGVSAAGGGGAAAAQRDPFSFSDDEEGEETSFGYKFRIHIKAREDGDNPAAAGATGASAADLRVAASKLKSLGPPGTPVGASFREQLGKPPGQRAAGSSSTPGDDPYDLSFLTTGTAAAAAARSAGAGSPLPGAAGSSSSAAGAGLPPRAPSSAGAPAAPSPAKREESFDTVAEMAGIRSRSGGLGGPAMRPKPKQQQQVQISDEDFFAALAPAIVTGGGPAAAGAGSSVAAAGSSMQQQQQRQQSLQAGAAGRGAGPGQGFGDHTFWGSPGGAAAGSSGTTAAAAAAPPPAPEDFFADFSGTSSSTAALQPTQPSALKPLPPVYTIASVTAAAAAGTSRALQPPPGRAAAPAPAAPAPAAAGPTGGDATGLYKQGVAAMESAQWEAAAAAFAAALSALSAEPPSASRAQRCAFAAQYLAAVMLLKAAGADSTPKGAKLYRYAAGLKLDDLHRVALVKESVIRNKHAGNFRYAADQLTWLVTRSLGSAPMEIMAKLQEDIDECDRWGGRNAAIDGDENVEDWVSLVAAGSSKQDVEEVVLPLLQQA